MADIDNVIRKCVDDIWNDYCKNKSNSLTREETKNFVKSTLVDMGDDLGFSEEDFEACFEEFDLDKSGTIEKEEMVMFIKKMAGLI